MVTAYDLTSNESDFSAEVSLLINPPADTQAPEPPKNIKIVVSTTSSISVAKAIKNSKE